MPAGATHSKKAGAEGVTVLLAFKADRGSDAQHEVETTIATWRQAKRTMKRFATISLMILVVVAVYLHKQNTVVGWQPFRHSAHDAGSREREITKCVTKDGDAYFGDIPRNIVCAQTETVHLRFGAKMPATANMKESSDSTFRCDGRQYCSQMTSCAEARFFLQHCPNTKMDGDGDGIPCESQWCK